MRIWLMNVGILNLRGNTLISLSVEGHIISDPKIIANKFNTHFAKAAESIAKSIPKTDSTFEQFLPDYTSDGFKFRKINYSHIEDIVDKLESKKSIDIEGNCSFIVKKVAKLISLPLAHIVNLSLNEGSFPDNLKISRICPIFKSGDRLSMDNYRPISCLPIWSKIYERVVYDQFYLYLSTSRILNKSQFGFRRGKSTSHALLDVINYISNHLNDGNIVAAIFLDLRKAFDIVSHKILLKKLEHFGVTGQELSWFRDYLSNRKIITSCNGTLSNNNHYLSRSVPQGSILGPLILLFINDLPDSTI